VGLEGTIVQGAKGRYAILASAGEGGAATVYKARNVSTGDTVALKVLHSKRFLVNDVQRARFGYEIETMLDVSSEYLVGGIDSGEYGEEPFLVLEWTAGGTLEKVIENGQYGIDETIQYTAQLIKAFKELERLGVVHRDIKPSNVLLASIARLKLGDFGLARSLLTPTHLTATTARIGSLLYMSERQRFGTHEATARDDFYSLSLVLYELVSKRKIHTRNTLLEILRPNNATIALCRPDRPRYAGQGQLANGI
jgi:serine/threonine protein kinase